MDKTDWKKGNHLHSLMEMIFHVQDYQIERSSVKRSMELPPSPLKHTNVGLDFCNNDHFDFLK